MVLYEDPSNDAQVRMTIGVTVPSSVAVKPPLKLVPIRLSKAACHTHQGPYADLGEVHGAIKEEVRKVAEVRRRKAATEWPVVIKLLNNPKGISPGQLKSEMCVPFKES